MHEQIALYGFLASGGSLKDALTRFTRERALECSRMCAMHMATVPRDPERAADYAAKAQLLNEFWEVLADMLASESAAQAPQEEQVSGEPTP